MEMDERLAELKAEGYLVPRRKLLKTEEQKDLNEYLQKLTIEL